MSKIKRIISAALAVLMLAMSALLCGCDLFEQGLEDGFRITGLRDMPPELKIAYKSDTKEFDINDVTLSVYYGCVSNFELENETVVILFQNDAGKQIIVKELSIEEIYEEKYKVDWWGSMSFSFQHSESLTIPRELFSEKKGYVYLIIKLSQHQDKIDPFVDDAVKLFYKVKGDKVILSTREFWF